MSPSPQSFVRDPDLPSGSGWRTRLHLRLGRLAVIAKTRLGRPVTLGVRVLAFNANREILLVRPSYVPGLSLPGGGVDPGETCREAALREAREEAGLFFPEPLEFFGIYLNRPLGDRDHVVLFVGRNAERSPDVTPGLESRSASFYAPDDLPDDVTPATLSRIAEVLNGVQRSEHW